MNNNIFKDLKYIVNFFLKSLYNLLCLLVLFESVYVFILLLGVNILYI